MYYIYLIITDSITIDTVNPLWKCLVLGSALFDSPAETYRVHLHVFDLYKYKLTCLKSTDIGSCESSKVSSYDLINDPNSLCVSMVHTLIFKKLWLSFKIMFRWVPKVNISISLLTRWLQLTFLLAKLSKVDNSCNFIWFRVCIISPLLFQLEFITF